VLGFGVQVKRSVGRAEPACEASDLLYGDIEEQRKLVLGLTRGSDLLIAMVNCEELQEGHRQVAVRGSLGEGTYENVIELGFVPDLIVARCATLDEAKALVDWTVLGSQLICMVAPKGSDHKRWSATDRFSLQVFCGNDAFVLSRLTSLRRLPFSLPPLHRQLPSSR
jgi:hypothetical protein